VLRKTRKGARLAEGEEVADLFQKRFYDSRKAGVEKVTQRFCQKVVRNIPTAGGLVGGGKKG